MTEPKEDFLDEDPEIPSQKFVLLSFLSPEKVLARKDVFMFERFLKDYEVQWRLKNLEQFLVQVAKNVNKSLEDRAAELEKGTDLSGSPGLPELCRKSRIGVTGLLEEYQTFVKKNEKDMNKTRILEDWDNFMFKNRAALEDEFYAENKFRTTVRGVKIRGVFSSSQEAEVRSKKLQKSDTLNNIFVGQVGKWLAWDPEPNQVENQEYAEDQLNDLMKSYKKNEEARDAFYKERGGKPKKSVISMEAVASTETSDNGGASGNIFEAKGDLAYQRKAAAVGAVAPTEDKP